MLSSTQGEYSQAVFTVRCIKKQIEINKPIVDKWGYDFIIYQNGFYKKIQVKSCSVKSKDKKVPTYKFNVRKGNDNSKYERHHFDFIAAYIIPLDLFYIIPFSEINQTTIRINPTSDRCKFKKYKNNWNFKKAATIK